MKIPRAIFVTIAFVLLLAAASIANVKTAYDRNVDFSQYKTFSWKTIQTQEPLWADRIRSGVNAQLMAKGWRPIESGGQVAIMALEMDKNQRTLNTFYDNFGGGWRWGGGFGTATTTVDNYTVGTLVVDLFDANTKKIIWRASSSDTLSNKSDKNIKNLDKDVEKMFDHFPPEVKK